MAQKVTSISVDVLDTGFVLCVSTCDADNENHKFHREIFTASRKLLQKIKEVLENDKAATAVPAPQMLSE